MIRYQYSLMLEVRDVIESEWVTADGILTVPDGYTEDQIRQHVIDQAAAPYPGQLVKVTRWELARVEVAQ